MQSEAGEETHPPPKQLMKSLLPSRHVLLEIFPLIPSPTPFPLPEPRAENLTGLRPLLTPISVHFKFTL